MRSGEVCITLLECARNPFHKAKEYAEAIPNGKYGYMAGRDFVRIAAKSTVSTV
jgi:hypothetical protein